MKQGEFFPIPERPADLLRIWTEATPLSAASLPAWLSAADAGDFRLAGEISLAGLDSIARAAAADEFGLLELGRLIVSDDDVATDLHRVFVRRPEPEPVWSIGIRTGPGLEALRAPPGDEPILTAADVTDVPATSVADPFLLAHEGIWHVFCEVVNWRSWKGEIGLATSRDGLQWRYEQIVLSEAFHLSYPFVFCSGGDIWMVPETSQANAVRLYRARRFPGEWEHVADLLTGRPFADATLFEHGGRWWLVAETSGGRNDTLRLYTAERLTGPWREHPASPIVSGDATIARPGGRVVTTEGRILRIAQNCGPAYGTDVRILEIIELAADRYRELPGTVRPLFGPSGTGWNAAGMHHLDLQRRPDGSWLAAVDGWQIEAGP